MDGGGREEAQSNIPHMHLFMYLKRQFPGLKDADITDSIQRFGLDRGRCEAALTRRSEDLRGGHRSPWTRMRGSPPSPPLPCSPDPLHNGLFAPPEEPGSAPVLAASKDPFFAAAAQPPHRRSSADTATTATESPPRPATATAAQAAIRDQLARKERLKEALTRRREEKSRLEEEVKGLTARLMERQQAQRAQVDRSKEEIELLQQENSQLQFDCDEMEREILANGESPFTDLISGAGQRHPSSVGDLPSLSAPDTATAARPTHNLARASSASSLLSGGAGASLVSPSTPLTPIRKAPSPPPPTGGLGLSSPLAGHSLSQGMERGGATRSGAEPSSEWPCSKCTFINSPFLNECEICGFPHFPLGTPPHSAPSPPLGLDPGSRGGPCYCHHRHLYSDSRSHVREV